MVHGGAVVGESGPGAGVMGFGAELGGFGGARGGGGGVGYDGGVVCGAEEGQFAGEAVYLCCVWLVSGGDGEAGVERGLTTASCSFSSWRCRSAAVKGRGCRIGPGPGPTPELSPIACGFNMVGGAKCGDGREEELPALLTAL